MPVSEKKKAYMKAYRQRDYVKKALREYMARLYQRNPEKFRNIKLLEYHKKQGNITDQDIQKYGKDAILIYKTRKNEPEKLDDLLHKLNIIIES